MYKAPEAAGRAALHARAISEYASRSDADLAALPPAGQPLTPDRFAQLQRLSDNGNARAACALAQEAMKCNFLPKVGEKGIAWRESELAALVRDGKPSEQVAENLRRSREMLAELNQHCQSNAATLSETPAWQYGLRAALLGHEPSVEQFVMMPMFDPTDWSASVDAYAARMTYYAPMLEALAQRGHPFLSMQASLEYGGDVGVWEVFGAKIRMSNIEPDPVRALGYAYVRQEIVRRTAAIEPSSEEDRNAETRRSQFLQTHVEGLEAKANAQQKEWAREFANQTIANLGQDWKPRPEPAPSATDEKRSRFDDFDEVCRRL